MQIDVKISQWQEARDDLKNFMIVNQQIFEAMEEAMRKQGQKDSLLNSARDLWQVAPCYHPSVSIGTDWWIMLTRGFIQDCIKEIDKQKLRKAA